LTPKLVVVVASVFLYWWLCVLGLFFKTPELHLSDHSPAKGQWRPTQQQEQPNAKWLELLVEVTEEQLPPSGELSVFVLDVWYAI
jgi:hypothetical protein